MDATELLLQELIDAPGVSGHESEIAAIMKKHLKPFADELLHDKLGSMIAVKKGAGDSPRVMIASHMDEVGFLVKEIDKNGFIRFLPLGGWWGHVVLSQRVVVQTKKGPVIGVVGSTPPHMLQDDVRKKVMELKDMYIDVGVKSGFDVRKKLGIREGDAIVPYSPFMTMGNSKMYLGKAFDDRVGCALIIDLFKKLQRVKHPNLLFGVGTAQEEVGLRGAATAAWAVNPDVAIAIDVGIAQDMPGMSAEAPEKLGAGPAIFIYDAGLVPNSKLRDLVIEAAQQEKIPFHFTTLERGATDAGRIHLSRFGVPSICVGVNTRYVHAHSGIIYREDYNNCLRLLIEIVKRLDKKTVENLVRV